MNPIPNPVKVMTGDQERVSKTINDFFVETKRFVQETYKVRNSYGSSQVTDDRITYLCYIDSILAAVFETRTEFNVVRYTFFRNLEGFGKSVPKKRKTR